MLFQTIVFRTTLILAALPLATSCTKKNLAVDKATQEQVLLLGNGTEPQGLDHQLTTGIPEAHVTEALFEGLTTHHPKDLSPEPGMAESWTISKDQKVYTFKIRKNAVWSNGDPLTAEDFVLSWKRMLMPTLAAEYAYMLFYVKNAEKFNQGTLKDFSQVGVKALDPYTLEVTLENATPFFLSLLSHHSTFPVPVKVIEKLGALDAHDSKWTRPENIVGNGPFTLAEWKHERVIRVVKNPKYWDAERVKLKEIRFFPIESNQTEEKNFRSGELHVTDTIPIPKIEVYKRERPEVLRIDPYLGTYIYRINVTKKPFDDVRIRRAFAMTIDRKQIVERVTKGGQIPALSMVPPDTAGYTSRNLMEYNPEKARALLAEAGFPGGKGLPKAEILFNTNESHKVIAEAIQQMWKKELGVEVTLANQDWKVYQDTMKKLNYNLARYGWIGDYNDPNTFLDMFTSASGNNQTGWASKQYDSLIAEAARTTEAKARLEVLQKAEKVLLDEAPIIPIYYYTRLHLVLPEVKGWYQNILDVHPYKYVSLEKNTEESKKAE